MRILVLGSSGMLGRYTSKYLQSAGYTVIHYTRPDGDIRNIENIKGYIIEHGAEVVINCIGAIKPTVDRLGKLNAIYVNSIFPNELADLCQAIGINCIHITTDCIYYGDKGNYTEDFHCDSGDIYGMSKALGEPDNCTVIRTSIIGEELGEGRSLVEWVKSNKNGKINGFTNHFWNGVTCLQLAKIFDNIIKNDLYWHGVRHISTEEYIDKFVLLSLINDIYSLNIEITPVKANVSINRVLSSNYKNSFSIPDLKTQIIEMAAFKLQDENL